MSRKPKVPKTPPTLSETLDEVLYNDFGRCGVNYDYDRERHCDEGGCDGICRCSTIEHFKITEIELDHIAEEFFKLAEKNDTFIKYCIYRALVICKLYDKDSWDWNKSHSYYGEEINWVKIEDSKKLKVLLTEILGTKNNKKKLFAVLEKEYGYILSSLEEFDDFEIVKVETKNIITGDEDHYKRLESDVVDQYKKYTLPIGVGIEKSGKIKLIDGYHRYAAKKNEKFVEIIVGKKKS